jgi:hypothetical protein
MKAKVPVSKWLPLVAAAVLCCALNLPAQTAPTITTQPASQTNLAGTTATFAVAVTGTGPFTYQWQLNGDNLPNGIISTMAGGGSNLDGTVAVGASLSWPSGLAFDGAGNMYIADNGDARVRKVGTNGIISTVAGNGTNGYSGDGGPATWASLRMASGPATNYASDLFAGGGTQDLGSDGLSIDALGNMYIADCWNERIRKVDANGIITTVAGTGTAGYLGDGGPASNAELDYPSGVAVDAAGNLYIADGGNKRIRKVDTNGIITTVAGTNGYGCSGEGGPATNAVLNNASGVCLDAAGNLFIADVGNYRVREVHFAGFPTLAMTNVSATNAGSYAVVVTSPYGSVTSAVAAVTVQAPPVITQQPTNQTVSAGSSPTFSVAAAGSGTFEYFWFLASTNLLQSGASPSLTLPCVFTNNAGSYTVIVTNTWGSVTSAVATLTVTIPTNAPQIVTGDGCCGFLDNQFGFNLSGAYGQTIIVDGSTDLVNWTPLFTNTCVGDGGSAFYFCDPCWTNFALRFYRARLP